MLKNSDKGIKREKLGGNGKGTATAFPVEIPDQDGAFTMATRLELDAGATISYHTHAENEEVYFIAEGKGVYCEDNECFDAHPGDIFLCRKGHSHGIENTGAGKLVVVATIAKRG